MKKLLFLFITIALTSCFSNKKLVSSSKYEAVQLSNENLVGHYSNEAIDTPSSRLWNILADNKSFNGYDTRTSENATVKIQMTSSNDKFK